MISRRELQRLAAKKGLNISTMEKDYVLTWALKAIFANTTLSNALIFKGGTCLSKIYAENYRLSEDLDFTRYKRAELSPAQLEQELRASFETIKNEGGPELSVKEKDTHATPGHITFQIQYNAVLGRPARIKLDLNLKERVIYPVNESGLRGNIYPDIGNFKVRCYALQEIAAEKMRALFQRGHSRDYYDLWKIMTVQELKKELMIKAPGLRGLLYKKCDLNGIKYEPELMFDEKQLEAASAYWSDALRRTVSQLPDFDSVVRELRDDIFFEESELTAFLKDLKGEHLDDIYRGENTEFLLRRAAKSLLEKLSSTKRKRDIMDVLACLHRLYTRRDYAPIVNVDDLGPLNQLKWDKDDEIKSAAKGLIETMQAKKKVDQLPRRFQGP